MSDKTNEQTAEVWVHPVDEWCGDNRCAECCEHEETECGVCNDCGTDTSETMMANAYDRAKAARQDG